MYKLLFFIYFVDYKDLRHLIIALQHISNRWIELGTLLNLLHPDLQVIKKEQGGNACDCMREMLALWLKKEASPTEEDLKVALQLMNVQHSINL